MAAPGFAPPLKAFQYAPEPILGAQAYYNHAIEPTWHNLWPALDDNADSRPERRRSKKRAKHRSKAERKRWKQEIGQYVLQVIGLMCLIMAAIKGFEPLIGVGFTLVLIGHDKKLKKSLFTNGSDEKRPKKTEPESETGDARDEGQATSKEIAVAKRRKKHVKLELEDDSENDYVFV